MRYDNEAEDRQPTLYEQVRELRDAIAHMAKDVSEIEAHAIRLRRLEVETGLLDPREKP